MGTQNRIERIRKTHPEVLVAGEGWYDSMTLPTPLTQFGYTDGLLHWYNEPFADSFDIYNRSFAHRCLAVQVATARAFTSLAIMPGNAAPQRYHPHHNIGGRQLPKSA